VRRNATGIVLAGGASRRMGRDKATLLLQGRTLLERAAGAVSQVCDELIIATADRPAQDIPGLHPIWVRDAPGTAGPLAGLATGLSVASCPVAVVVACDMPFLSERMLGDLLDRIDGCDAVVPLGGGVPQPLHAAYSRDCLPTVEALLRLGAPSMRELLSRLRVKYVGEERCRELDPPGLSWFNMNTPDDLRRAHTLPAFQASRVHHVAA
jgi:molybdopterin-guanine dinucleotide biosynthesis protein A